MSRLTPVVSTIFLLLLTGCAGIPTPVGDFRLGYLPVEDTRRRVNSRCIDLKTLNIIATQWQKQHLTYLRALGETPESITTALEKAIDAPTVKTSLGPDCEGRFIDLQTSEIKTELFGDVQTIKDSANLILLGGLAFDYQDVSTKLGVELSLHVRKASKGPKHRMVAIYRLVDNRVIHYNYSGIDDVDGRSRSWALPDVLRTVSGAAIKAAVPTR